MNRSLAGVLSALSCLAAASHAASLAGRDEHAGADRGSLALAWRAPVSAAGSSGLAGFTFSVTDTDGDSMSRSVGVWMR